MRFSIEWKTESWPHVIRTMLPAHQTALSTGRAGQSVSQILIFGDRLGRLPAYSSA